MKKRKYLFLLSVFFLTVIFISGNMLFSLSAKGKKAEILNVQVTELPEKKLKLSFERKGFKKKKAIQVKLFFSERKDRFSSEEQYKTKIKKEETKEIEFSTEVENSGYYYLKVLMTQGKKKAEKILETPMYLSGKYATAKPLIPEANFIDDVLHIRWEEGGASNYWVGILNPSDYTVVEEMITSKPQASFALETEKKNLSVAVAPMINGLKGDFMLSVLPDREQPNTLVSFLGGDVFNKAELKTDIIFTGDCKIDLEINGVKELENATEQGRFQFRLPEGNVVVKAVVKAENGNVKHFEKSIYVDTVSPTITLDSSFDGAVTGDESVVVSGGVDEEVTLTFNEKIVPQDRDGRFNVVMNLEEGENDFKLIALDKAGNTANVRAVVKREIEHEPNFKIVLLVGGTFGLIFLAYFLTFIRWMMRRRAAKS